MRTTTGAFLISLALSAVCAAQSGAQVRIGTDPDAPYILHGVRGQDADMIRQSFVIPAALNPFYTFLTIGVWLDPSQARLEWTQYYFTLWSNATDYDEIVLVDPTYTGWYTFTFSGVPLNTGSLFFFAIVGNENLDYFERCTDLVFEDHEPDAECPADLGRVFTRRTTVDAYPFGNADDRSDESGDVVFRALFHDGSTQVVPEPITMLLLGTGLAGVGAMARRSRRSLFPRAGDGADSPTDRSG